MENSSNSSMSRAAISSINNQSSCYDSYSDDHSNAESGWTAYLEDFMVSEENKKNNNRQSSNCSTYSSYWPESSTASMVSDAASCAAWKLLEGVGHQAPSKKLRNVRRKVLNEDPLEDTASSSPVDSPKISDLSYLSTPPRNKIENRNISQEKSAFGQQRRETTMNNNTMLGLTENINNEYTDLNKKGLCLVPLSLLVDFLG